MAIQPDLNTIAEGIHNVTASSTVMRDRIMAGKDPSAWYARAAEGRKQLDAVRPRVKYSLYGLTEPLRVLSRMPDWLSHTAKANSEVDYSERLLRDMQALQVSVDMAVRWSYRRGLPPGLVRRLWLAHEAKRPRSTFRQLLSSPAGNIAGEDAQADF